MDHFQLQLLMSHDPEAGILCFHLLLFSQIRGMRETKTKKTGMFDLAEQLIVKYPFLK